MSSTTLKSSKWHLTIFIKKKYFNCNMLKFRIKNKCCYIILGNKIYISHLARITGFTQNKYSRGQNHPNKGKQREYWRICLKLNTKTLFLTKATVPQAPMNIFLYQGTSQPSADFLKLEAIHMISPLRSVTITNKKKLKRKGEKAQVFLVISFCSEEFVFKGSIRITTKK